MVTHLLVYLIPCLYILTGTMYGTALQAAAAEGKLEIARFLLAKGAEINLNVPGEFCDHISFKCS
jgi:hypothetical protein